MSLTIIKFTIEVLNSQCSMFSHFLQSFLYALQTTKRTIQWITLYTTRLSMPCNVNRDNIIAFRMCLQLEWSKNLEWNVFRRLLICVLKAHCSWPKATNKNLSMHNAHIGARTNEHTLTYCIGCWLLTLSQIPNGILILTFQFESIRSNNQTDDGKTTMIWSMKHEGLFDCCACWIEWRKYVTPVLLHVNVIPSIVNDLVTKWNL